jgi:DNA topoisomerase-1
LKDKDESENFLNEAKDSEFTISKIEVKPGKKTPSAPFTTSTLQQEASRKL